MVTLTIGRSPDCTRASKSCLALPALQSVILWSYFLAVTKGQRRRCTRAKRTRTEEEPILKPVVLHQMNDVGLEEKDGMVWQAIDDAHDRCRIETDRGQQTPAWTMYESAITMQRWMFGREVQLLPVSHPQT